MSLPTLRGQRVTLRPLADADLDPLVAMIEDPSVARWWGALDDLARVREDLRCDGTAWAISVDGALAGWLGVSEERDPDYRHAGLDVMLGPSFQDRGLGSEALRLAVAWLLGERGHHRLTIDPAAANARAVRCYEAVGFRRVGVMRAYVRRPDGAWEDGLLMDLLADEQPR